MCQKRLNSKLYSADRLMSIDNGLDTAIWSGTAARSIGSAARRLQSWRIAYTKKGVMDRNKQQLYGRTDKFPNLAEVLGIRACGHKLARRRRGHGLARK